jgi:hypothetical protein
MFIPIKVLIWCFLLKYVDSGTTGRITLIGAGVGLLFGVLDLVFDRPGLPETASLFGGYMVLGAVFLNIRCRLDGIFSSVLLAAISTAVMAFGVPVGVAFLFDPELR